MVNLLQRICQSQGVQVEEQALQLVAKMAEGGARDALSLLDQAISYSKDQVRASDIMQITGTVAQSYFSVLARYIAQNDVAQVMEQFDRVMVQGKDPEQFLHDFLYYYRDMLLLKTAPQLEEIVERTMIDDQFPGGCQAVFFASPVCDDRDVQPGAVPVEMVDVCAGAGGADTGEAVPAKRPGSGGDKRNGASGRQRGTDRYGDTAQYFGAAAESGAARPSQLARPAKSEEPRKSEPRRVVAAAGGGSRTPLNRVREVAKALDENLTRQVRGSGARF